MYTILMNSDKSLTTTQKMRIHQREKLVDNFQFLLPQTYGELELKDFKVELKYIDTSEVVHAEILTMDEELYKEKLRYTLPIDTMLTKNAGTMKLRLTLTKVDLSEGKQYVLHSGETTVEVLSVTDYYKFIPDESLEFVDQLVGTLEAQIQALTDASGVYADKLVDDLILTDDLLQVGSKGVPMGTGVKIVTKIEDGEVDGDANGILELDEIEL